MEIRKLLVADASPSFCAALSEILGCMYELRICHDGLQALSLLHSFCPDILVTDLALPGLDGISLLRSAADCAKQPVRLVTTRFCSPYIEGMISQLGVDYMVMKPCDMRALAERIHDLSQCDSVARPVSCRTSIGNLLLMLGVPAGRKGYPYLERIIELYGEDSGRSLTKELYPAVGRENRVSGASVERAVRSAVHTAWEQRDEAVWRLYFSAGRSGRVPRPTNRSFIATLAEVLGKQEQLQAK